jgi:hypothetical protein
MYLVQSNTSKRLTVGNLFSNVAVDLVPTVNNANNIGSASFRWRQVFAANLNISTSASIANANLTGFATTISSNVLPAATGVWSLGNTDYRFRSIWLTGSSSIYLGSNTAIRSDDEGNVTISMGQNTLFANADGSVKVGTFSIKPTNTANGSPVRPLVFTNAELDISNLPNIANVDFGRGPSTVGMGPLVGDLAFNLTTSKLMIYLGNVLGFANVA